jgi:hypothetical protein
MAQRNSLPHELARRKTARECVYELLLERQQQWVGIHDLARVGGFAAWRTRVSECRELAARDGSEILWNGSVKDSKYMLRPKRLGRDAGTAIPQKLLFCLFILLTVV